MIESDNTDCEFTDANGISYIFFQGNVTDVKATERSAGNRVELPLGLVFGDSPEVAARKVRARGGTWNLIRDPGGVTLMSRDRYAGKNGWDFAVELQFERGRLVEVTYAAGVL